MRYVLGVGGLFIGLIGFVTLLLSKSAVNEGVAAIIILIGAVAFVGGALLEGMRELKTSLATLTTEVIAVRKAIEKRD
jgi:hypothetical protein